MPIRIVGGGLMSLLEQMELKLRQIWREYQKSLKDEAKSRRLLCQYRDLYASFKKQRLFTEGVRG